ncbi:hypothetical protein [Brevibacillus borstelensis]|uniref:hypothetical protein n=1 Tax=Brevibacillus borstelensis TaxID=45462 RepID=UPI0030BCF470
MDPKKAIFSAIVLFALTGCEEKPLFSVSFGQESIEPQHQTEVRQWLQRPDQSSEAVQMYDMEGYVYYSVKGYKDVSVSYILEESHGEKKSTLKTTFVQGKDSDALFVKVKYDPEKCCDLIVIDEQP